MSSPKKDRNDNDGATSASASGSTSGSLTTKNAKKAAKKQKARATQSGGTAPFEVGRFTSGGIELYYEIHGSGPRVLVFMHGILMDANLNRRLASDLATLGNRVILLDLPGHGLSDKPTRASYHRMDTYARHVVNLLDHLEIDKAVVGGVSLGGNVALLVAAQNPERVQGLVIEMPVLEWALPVAAFTFMPLLMFMHLARPVASRFAWLMKRAPRTGNGPFDSLLNSMSLEPQQVAAILHGILAGPIAPTVGKREDTNVPALVIGHSIDQLHPFHDAEQLSRRLPNARLLQANSMLELRMHPERLTAEINQLLDEAWDPKAGSAWGTARTEHSKAG